LGSGGAPPGAGDVHPVLDQKPCRALDDSGGDLPAAGQGGGVVQVGGLAGEVGGRLALTELAQVAGVNEGTFPGVDRSSYSAQATSRANLRGDPSPQCHVA
jgi:hypothetical protein